MVDSRPIQQKLLAIIDPGSGATQGERDNATALLKRLAAMPARTETPRGLTREAILAQVSRSGPPEPPVRVRYPDGTWVAYDADDVDWETIKALDLPWRRY